MYITYYIYIIISPVSHRYRHTTFLLRGTSYSTCAGGSGNEIRIRAFTAPVKTDLRSVRVPTHTYIHTHRHTHTYIHTKNTKDVYAVCTCMRALNANIGQTWFLPPLAPLQPTPRPTSYWPTFSGLLPILTYCVTDTKYFIRGMDCMCLYVYYYVHPCCIDGDGAAGYILEIRSLCTILAMHSLIADTDIFFNMPARRRRLRYLESTNKTLSRV